MMTIPNQIGFLVFSGFHPGKIAPFAHLIMPTLNAVSEYKLIPWAHVAWPWRVRAMTDAEVRAGKKTGHGHGLYIEPPPGRPGWEADVAINSEMPSMAIYLNLIHELIHHVNPSLTDKQINDKVVPTIFKKATGLTLDKKAWRSYRGTNPDA